MIDILLGPIYLFVGMAACGIAALRRRGASRPLVWFGLFIAIFGMRMLAEVTAFWGLCLVRPGRTGWSLPGTTCW
jgi:hypothetical protein